jgi:type IV pilus assembly protein PilQ
MAIMAFGCAETPKEQAKDPFFEKWRAMAEESKGFSPAPLEDTPVAAEQVTAETAMADIEPEPERPLPDRKISLKMNNIDVAVLLRALARAADQNIVLNEKVRGKININISQAPWDEVFLSILRTHGLSYAWEGEIIRIMTADDMEEDLRREARRKELQITEPPITRIVEVKYAEAPKLRDNLEKFLTIDRNGKPIGSILVDEHTNSVIINALRSDLKTILSVLGKLDKPTPQVLIEAYIVEANKDVARELGVQWGGVVQASNNAHNLSASGNTTGSFGSSNSSNLFDATSEAVVDLPADALAGLGPATLGVLYQNIGDALLTVQLSALQDQGKLNILSSPSITTLDNQTALIESGQDVPFQSVEDGEVNVEYKKAVLSLQVKPHVIDLNTLKMYIKVNKDEPDFTRTVLGNPTIITKNAETNVIQFDGQTIVIGGLNKETTARDQSGVPLLEDLPGLGYFFKKKGSSNQLEDLLIFITPHILQPPIGSGG